MKYITICKALYDYESQSDEELTFKEDDVLYILENEDPDWWKAQLKTASLDQVGPIGLVPSNYIDEAEPIGTVKALFDYQAQQEEELKFHEDDIMVLYENDDPDWFLVKSREGQIGLAPSNYIETITADNDTKQPVTDTQPAVSVFSALSNTPDVPRTLNTNDEAISWSVNEYDVEKKKKKKGKGNLLVGNGMFCYGSETDKASPVRQFSILDISDYSQDGKNVHVELGIHTFDFQASSKSEAKAIMAKLDDSRSIANKAQASASTPPLANAHPTLARSSPSPAPSTIAYAPITAPETEQPICEPRWAIVLYDFEAQGEEELNVKEQEQVLIIDYVSSDEWWTVEHQDGRVGIVPTTYLNFQEDYEAKLANEQQEIQRQHEQAEQQQQREREATAARQRRLEEEAEKEKERQRQQEQQERQQQQLEKEYARQAEAERRRKMQDEAKQRELDAKRAAARAAAANSPQIASTSSPRRSQIPAPLPPTTKVPAAKALPSDQAVNSISVPSNRSLPDRPKQANDSGKPDPDKVRTWTDRTGAFKVEAQFVTCNNGKIRLHKINGVKIDVPVQKMCMEDIHYIEQETGARLLEDTSDNIPLAQLTNKTDDAGFNWFDYFNKINIPSKSALRYAASFQQEGLREKDVDHLTHRKMKTLGMEEKHVQRLQRYLEHQTPEPPSDDEDVPVGKKGKKSVTFGSTSVIHDIDSGDDDFEAQRQRQIEEDENLARQLQLQENDTTRSNLHRRGTGRPTPANSAPKDMTAQIMDKIKNQLRTEPLVPSPIPVSSTQNINTPTSSTPSAPSPVVVTASTPRTNVANQQPGFQDDAWANRNPPSSTIPVNQLSSWARHVNPNAAPASASPQASLQSLQPTALQPSAPVALSHIPSIQQQQQQQQQQQLQQHQHQHQQQFREPQSQQLSPATAPLPPRQRPVPQLSQTNQVNPQLLAQWTNNTDTGLSQQQQPVLSTLQHQQHSSFSPMIPSTNVTQTHPPLPPRSPNLFMQQQSQQTSSPQQFHPQLAYGQNQQQQSLSQPNHTNPQVAISVPVSSILPPPLVPLSGQMTALKPQPTGRNWTTATPDNPFGQGQQPQHPTMNPGVASYSQQMSTGNSNTSLQPAQIFASMTGNHNNMAQQQQPNPNDPYAVFKSMNPQAPTVFNPQQHQMPAQFQQPQQTGFIPQPQQQQFYNNSRQ